MFRTWPVKLLAIELTESVRSFHVSRPHPDLCLTTEFAIGAHFAGDARYFSGEHAQLLNHGVHDLSGTQELAFQRDDRPHRVARFA